MTISSGEIKRNMTILLDDEVYQILDWQHRQAPKAPPTLTLKVRNILTGNVYEKKLQGNQKLTKAETDNISAQYLYEDDAYYCFMDNITFEQFNIDKNIIGDNIKFINEGDNVELIMFNGNALNLELPPSVILASVILFIFAIKLGLFLIKSGTEFFKIPNFFEIYGSLSF